MAFRTFSALGSKANSNAEFSGMAGGGLLGASRKSFIGFLTGDGDRLTGSLAAAMIGATANVDLVRVHDVKETLSAVKAVNNL